MEVGTGKSHAYMIATIINSLLSENQVTTLISTSTIALQQSLVENYLPKISEMLLNNSMIDSPLNFAVIKGKKHFVCERRLQEFVNMQKNHSNAKENIYSLEKLRDDADFLDLDSTSYRNFTKDHICVQHCLKGCRIYKECRYHQYKKYCHSGKLDFLIVNHNYFVADINAKGRNLPRLLPRYQQVIVDEAHKLPAVIQSMYQYSFSEKEIEQLMLPFKHLCTVKEKQLKVLITNIQMKNKEFFEYLMVRKKENAFGMVVFTQKGLERLHSLMNLLLLFSEQVQKIYKKLPDQLNGKILKIESLVVKLQELYKVSKWIFWVEIEENTMILRYFYKKKGELWKKDFWDLGIPTVLTSGTISVNGNFDYFKSKCGLTEYSERISEITVPSPFDFQTNALLYLPIGLPYPDKDSDLYRNAILSHIQALIKATAGHTLLLFSSFVMMEHIHYRLTQKENNYPLFIMKNGNNTIIEGFKRSKNAVLFASDSVGEGIDLAGDIVSSVIIVKLPFPVPDIHNSQTFKHIKTKDRYMEQIIIPEMLTKLRQWIGRGIRTETDTCVFSILDSRANGKYNEAISHTLSYLPKTHKLEDVANFMKKKKGIEYFE